MAEDESPHLLVIIQNRTWSRPTQRTCGGVESASPTSQAMAREDLDQAGIRRIGLITAPDFESASASSIWSIS